MNYPEFIKKAIRLLERFFPPKLTPMGKWKPPQGDEKQETKEKS
jgi:hypothetical protein